MLAEGIDASSAAYEVGYESVSQFSREYSRFFGQPPMRDIRALRLGVAGNALNDETGRDGSARRTGLSTNFRAREVTAQGPS